MQQSGGLTRNDITTFADFECAIDALKWLTAPGKYAVPYADVMPMVFELRRQQTERSREQGRAP